MTWIANIFGYLREVWSFRHEPEHFRRLTDLYWRILLILALLVIAGAATYGYVKFMAVLKEREGGVLGPTGEGIPLLNKKDLQATIEGFEARVRKYEALKQNPPKIADPSK